MFLFSHLLPPSVQVSWVQQHLIPSTLLLQMPSSTAWTLPWVPCTPPVTQRPQAPCGPALSPTPKVGPIFCLLIFIYFSTWTKKNKWSELSVVLEEAASNYSNDLERKEKKLEGNIKRCLPAVTSSKSVFDLLLWIRVNVLNSHRLTVFFCQLKKFQALASWNVSCWSCKDVRILQMSLLQHCMKAPEGQGLFCVECACSCCVYMALQSKGRTSRDWFL